MRDVAGQPARGRACEPARQGLWVPLPFERVRRLAPLACALLAIAVLFMLSGCRDSDVLKEIIYDQTSLNIDYDNPEKFLYSDSSATEKSDAVAANEASEGAVKTDKENYLVVYSSKPNAPQYTAKKSVWDPNPDFKGLEASESVAFYRSDSPDATEQDIPDEQPEPEDEPKDEPEQPKVAQVSDSGKNTDKGDSGKGDSKKKGKKSSSKSKKKKSEPTKDGGGSGGDVKEVDTTGDFVEPPKTAAVAAYGQAAVMVQMLAGKGALVAADKKLLDGEFSEVFEDEGAADIAVGWSDDGSAAKIDADAIVKAKAKSVLVFGTDYKDDIPKAERAKLEDAGITVTALSPPVNSTYIKKDMQTIGEMLSESDALETGADPQGMAEKYIKFHDGLVKQCMKANGSKLAASPDNARVYELKNEKSYSFDTSARYTLLMDGYDTSARYADTEDGWPVTNGLALATVGYATTPASFYIQAGGLVNNAAARGDDGSSGQRVLWQFYGLKYSKAMLSYDAGGLVDEALDTKDESWDYNMFTTSVNKHQVGVGSSFGTETFPKVIAGNQRIREKFLKNANNKNGAYYPYHVPERESGQVIYFGKMLGDIEVFSCIGVDGDQSEENAFEDGVTSDSVVVNPHGLFASWTEGTPEAVLEAAWVNDVVNGSGSEVGWKDKVEEFYRTFYRYDCAASDLSAIEAGAEK